MRIFFVRNGDTEKDQEKSGQPTYGDSKLPLLKRGWDRASQLGYSFATLVEESKVLGADLSNFPIYASHHQSAQDTMAALKIFHENNPEQNPFLALNRRTIPNLSEMHLGLTGALTDAKNSLNTVRALQKVYEDVREDDQHLVRLPGGGESFADLTDRGDLVLLNKILPHMQQSSATNGVVIVPSIMMRAILMAALNLTPDRYEFFKPPKPCDVLCLKFNNATNIGHHASTTLYQVYDGLEEAIISEDISQDVGINTQPELPEVPPDVLNNYKFFEPEVVGTS